MSEDAFREAAVVDRAEAADFPYSGLAEELYRERVRRAQRASPESKILAGQRLFESACEITLLGIGDQNPGFTEDECRRILRERLAWRRREQAA